MESQKDTGNEKKTRQQHTKTVYSLFKLVSPRAGFVAPRAGPRGAARLLRQRRTASKRFRHMNKGPQLLCARVVEWRGGESGWFWGVGGGEDGFVRREGKKDTQQREKKHMPRLE